MLLATYLIASIEASLGLTYVGSSEDAEHKFWILRKLYNEATAVASVHYAPGLIAAILVASHGFESPSLYGWFHSIGETL